MNLVGACGVQTPDHGLDPVPCTGSAGTETAGNSLIFLFMFLLFRDQICRINTFYRQQSSCFFGKTALSSLTWVRGRVFDSGQNLLRGTWENCEVGGGELKAAHHTKSLSKNRQRYSWENTQNETGNWPSKILRTQSSRSRLGITLYGSEGRTRLREAQTTFEMWGMPACKGSHLER